MAAAAAAVVAAPAIAAKVAAADATPGPMYVAYPSPSLPPEAYMDGMEIRPLEEFRILTGEISPIYGVTFDEAAAMEGPPSGEVRPLGGQMSTITEMGPVRPDPEAMRLYARDDGSHYYIENGNDVAVPDELAARAMRPVTDTFLAHIEAAGKRWCPDRGCRVWTEPQVVAATVLIRHRVDGSNVTATLPVDGFLPYYRLSAEINRFEFWLASQHESGPVVSADVQRIMEMLAGQSTGATFTPPNHTHGTGFGLQTTAGRPHEHTW